MKNDVSLWDYYGGEPFLENPHLVVIGPNPPYRFRKTKQKGIKSMARRYAKRYVSRAARRNARRPSRRRYRRNYVTSGVVAPFMNPRHGRRRHYRRNPVTRHRRRHSYRRNPGIMGIELPPMQSVLYASVGFFVPPTIELLLNRYVLPTSFQTTAGTMGKYITRIAAVFGLAWGVKKLVGHEQGKMVAIGGGAYIVTTALTEAGFSLQRSLGLAGMGAYTGLPTAGLGAYTRNLAGLGAPPFGAQRPIGAASAPYGGMNIIPTRLRRFQ